MTTSSGRTWSASLTGFARALRAAGVAADRTRLTTALAALDQVDPGDADEVYWATRLTLCSEPDDLPRFDALFDVWFRGAAPAAAAGRRDAAPQAANCSPVRHPRPQRRDATRPTTTTTTCCAPRPATAEILRHRDLAELTGAERDEVHRLIALLAPRVGNRRTLRRSPRGDDRVDVRRTVRQMLTRRRRARRAALHRPAREAAPARAAARRQRVDGAVRRRAAALRPRRGARGTRHDRGVHARHPADPGHPAAAAARPRPRAAPRPATRSRTGAAAPGSARRCRRSSTCGGSAARPAARSSSSPATAGSAATRSCSASRWRGSPGWRTASSGSTRTAASAASRPVTGGMVAALPHVDELVAGHSLRLAEVSGGGDRPCVTSSTT